MPLFHQIEFDENGTCFGCNRRRPTLILDRLHLCNDCVIDFVRLRAAKVQPPHARTNGGKAKSKASQPRVIAGADAAAPEQAPEATTAAPEGEARPLF